MSCYSLLFTALFLFSFQSQAVVESPSESAEFLTLETGQNLGEVRVRRARLSIQRGSDTSLSRENWRNYLALKSEAMGESSQPYPLQWVLNELSTGRVIDQSPNPEFVFFGASVSKMFVAATHLDRENGRLTQEHLQRIADMLVVSSNSAWTRLQRDIGGGSKLLGQRRIHAFTQGMGYEHTRGFQGWMEEEHGNELNVDELARFLSDTYNERYRGASSLWKILFTSRTGSARAKKYLPRSLLVGGKTGTYSGSTVDPIDDSPITVRANHHVIVFNVAGVDYSLSVLSDLGSNEKVALITGGLFAEHFGEAE